MKTTAKSEDIKLEAHNIAVGHIEESLKDIMQLIKDKRIEDEGVTQDQVDPETLSNNTEDQEFILTMEQQIKTLKAQRTLIDKYKNTKPTTIVDPGSLVFVQDQVFYISTSVESFNYKGYKIKCISVEAPIYQKMKGLTAGNNFDYNGKSYTIEKIA